MEPSIPSFLLKFLLVILHASFQGILAIIGCYLLVLYFLSVPWSFFFFLGKVWFFFSYFGLYQLRIELRCAILMRNTSKNPIELSELDSFLLATGLEFLFTGLKPKRFLLQKTQVIIGYYCILFGLNFVRW